MSGTPAPQAEEMVTLRLTRDQFEELRLGALGIRTYMPETLPAGEDGKLHFARVLAEAAAEAIETVLAAREGSADV